MQVLIVNRSSVILLLDNRSSKFKAESLHSSASPKKLYPTNIKNIVSEKKNILAAVSPQSQAIEPQKVEASQGCKCIKLEDSGCSVYMSTPLILKWSINNLFFTSSIYRIVWNFKDVEIINVTSRIGSMISI